MKKLLSLLLILSTPAYADSAVTVHTGDVVQPAYNGGTLLDKEKANKVKDQLIDADSCKQENESYQKSLELFKNNEKLYTDENSLLLNRNIELSKTLNDTRTTSDWVKVGYVLLGMGVTALAVYGAGQLRK